MIYINTINISFYKKDEKLHRIGGPAYIEGNYKEWWKNGKYHRIGGPAVINRNDIYWIIEGIEYTETEYHHKIKEMGLG